MEDDNKATSWLRTVYHEEIAEGGKFLFGEEFRAKVTSDAKVENKSLEQALTPSTRFNPPPTRSKRPFRGTPTVKRTRNADGGDDNSDHNNNRGSKFSKFSKFLSNRSKDSSGIKPRMEKKYPSGGLQILSQNKQGISSRRKTKIF